MNLIVSDTDFLSSFVKIDKIELVVDVLKQNVTIPEAVYSELKRSKIFDKTIKLIADGKIKIKKAEKVKVPEYLGEGEREAISLARKEKAVLLMDDRKAAKYAESEGVKVIDVPTFLLYCKQKKALSKEDLEKVIKNLKEKDHYEFNKGVEKELLK